MIRAVSVPGRLRSPLPWLVALGLGVGALLVPPAGGSAQEPAPMLRRYEIELLTMGPGELLVARFGHNALRVRDRQRRTDRVFNWGTFQFGPDTPRQFAMGRLRYWLSEQGFQETLEIYGYYNRYVKSQRLDLDDEAAAALVARVEQNALPANRYYRYHHFDDNCSTRVRDLLDHATRGALHRVARGPTGRTFRQYAYDGLGPDLAIIGLLDVFTNYRFDRPASRWDELFLPERLHDAVARVLVRHGAGSRPLVLLERTYVPRRGPPPDLHAPVVRPTWLVFGALALLLASAVALAGRAPRAARWLGTLGLVLHGLLGGLAGLASLLFWALTDHADLAWNANLLALWPTDLLLVVLGPMALGARRRGARMLARYLAVHAAATLGLVLAALVGLVRQDVGPVAVPVLGLLATAAVLAWTRVRDAAPATAPAAEARDATAPQ